MKQLTFDPIVIFSVYKTNRRDNIYRHQFVKTLLDTKNIAYKELRGVYKGETEVSFLIGASFLDLAIEIANDHDQESILVSDAIRNTRLFYLNSGASESEYLGKLTAVSKEYAEKLDAYSYCPILDTYYATIKESEI